MVLKNIEINPQFERALELMENRGARVFITGRAGTGKSTLLSKENGLGKTYFAEMLNG